MKKTKPEYYSPVENLLDLIYEHYTEKEHWGLTPMWSTKYPFLVFQNQLSMDQFIHVLDDSLRGCNV